MHGITARNVNDAYRQGRFLLASVGVPENSRAGPVLVSPTPVITVYERPCERVLFDETRDANPFFHLFESIWMLAGRDDAAFLNQFVRDFGSRFAEKDDGLLYGAYGNRWRYNFGVDQLDVVVARLQRDPADRRVVLTMWDPSIDLIGPDDRDPETGEWVWLDDPEPRDLPCNTHIYPRVRQVNLVEETGDPIPFGVLDLTVLCRSNDIVWGAYGANAVHFSVLQEYLAAAIGVEVGTLYQFSNNWHGYTDVLAKMPLGEETDEYSRAGPGVRIRPHPMVNVPGEFLRDCERFCSDGITSGVFANKWFHNTAIPLYLAWICWREAGDKLGAIKMLDSVEASDWRLAAQRWMQRRLK